MHRRFFLKTALASVIPASAGTAAYGLYESGLVQVTRPTLALPHLPKEFNGTTVAFLSDFLHGPYTSLDFVNSVVRTTLALEPDLIVLGGNYTFDDRRFIGPCFDTVAALKAPLGVFGVLGNHDHDNGLSETRAGFRTARIGELTNRGVWLQRGASRFRLAGVDDMWRGQVNLSAALGDATATDACLLLSHNPEVAEHIRDPRVSLMLSGHTLGGKVILLTGDAPSVLSRYERKYLKGLVQAPQTKVYISRGLGTTSAPFRLGSRPELTLITLTA